MGAPYGAPRSMPSWNSDLPVIGLVREPKGEVTGPVAGTIRLPRAAVARPGVTDPEACAAPAGGAESDPSVLAGVLGPDAAASPRARSSVAPKSAPAGARMPTLAHSESMRLIASTMSAIGAPGGSVGTSTRASSGNRRGVLPGGRGQPPVAQTGLGRDPPGTVGVVPQLPPELADVDPQVGRLIGVADSPDFLQQPLVSEELSRVAGQGLEQAVLLGCQLQHLPLHVDEVPGAVD